MAESYRGLTIRIGGDTSGLNKALKAANSAIHATQGQLRALKTALRLDPGNADAAKLQVGAIADQAVNAASKLATLREAYRQLGDTNVGGQKLKELSDATDTAELSAARALQVYNAVDSKLADLYARITQISKEAGLDEVFNADNSDLGDIAAALDLAASKGVIAKQEAQELLNTVSSMKNNWFLASEELDSSKQVAQFQNLEVEISKTAATMNGLEREFVQLSSTSNAGKGIEDLNNRMRTLDSAAEIARDRFERLDKASKLDPRNLDLARERASALADVTSIASEKAKVLREAIARYEHSGIERAAEGSKTLAQRLIEAREAAVQLKQQEAEARGELENLSTAARQMELLDQAEGAEWDKLVNDIEEAENKMQELSQASSTALKQYDTLQAQSELRKLDEELLTVEQDTKNVSQAAQTSFGDLAMVIANSAVQLGNYVRQGYESALEAGVEIDSAYRDMRKTVNATEGEYEKLRDAAIEFSQTHVTSADQMLEMEALAGQVGISAEHLQEYAEAASNLDVATNIDAEDIALKMGQMINVMDDFDPVNVEQFADALVRLGNNTAAQESSILEIAQRLSGVASITGMSTPQVLAWADAIASTGQKSESAATAINNTMSQIESAVANGGDDLNNFAAVAGKSAEEFAKAWRDDPSEALKSFIDGLASADENNESVVAILENLGIKGVRQKQAIMGLAETVDNLGGALEMSQNAWDGVSDEWGAAGDAAREAARKSDGLSGAMSKLENTGKNLRAEFGEALAPSIEDLTAVLQDVYKWFHNLDDETKHTIASFGGIFAALSVVAPVAQTIGGSWMQMIGALKDSAPILMAKEGLGGLATSLGGLVAGNPLMLVAAGIGGIAAIIGGSYIARMMEADAQTQRFNEALEGVTRNVGLAGNSVEPEVETISLLGESAKSSSEHIDELITSLGYHKQAIDEAKTSAEDQIERLNSASDTIDQYIGQTDLSAKAQGELQAAIEVLNEELGTTITLEDVLNGTYQDEEGNVKDLREEIDKLTESRKRQAQAEYFKTLYNENYAAQQEAAEATEKAKKAQEDYDQAVKDTAEDLMRIQGVSRDDAFKLAQDDSVVQRLAREADEAARAQEEAGKAAEFAAEMMGLATRAEEGTSTAYENLVLDAVDLQNGLQGTGESVEAFTDNLGSIGIKVDDINKMDLAEFGSSFDGTIESILAYIDQYNASPLAEKNGTISIDDFELMDANGQVVIWNGTDLVYKETGAKVNDGDLVDAQGNKVTWNNTELRSKKASATVTGNAADGTAKKKIDETKQAEDRLYNKTVTVTANTAGKDKLDRLKSLYDQLQSKTITLKTYQQKVYSERHVPERASGGIIPRHADGFIATQATLTNHGWIGEAGAEAYTGNSIVPLTNTKYSKPFVDLIADGVIHRLTGSSGGDTYNMYLDYEAGASANQMARDVTRQVRILQMAKGA